MDLSDGLADALEQVAEASGVRFEIDRLLPVDPDAARWFEALGQNPSTAALAGGDDYELVFTVPARRRGRLRNVAGDWRIADHPDWNGGSRARA